MNANYVIILDGLVDAWIQCRHSDNSDNGDYYEVIGRYAILDHTEDHRINALGSNNECHAQAMADALCTLVQSLERTNPKFAATQVIESVRQ